MGAPVRVGGQVRGALPSKRWEAIKLPASNVTHIPPACTADLPPVNCATSSFEGVTLVSACHGSFDDTRVPEAIFRSL